MKKILFSILSFCLTTLSFAYEIQGTVTKLSGITVETHRPYSYIAMVTKDGQRIQLPSWINSEKINDLVKSKISVNAMVSPAYCTDMSAACLTGTLTNIRSVKIVFSNVNASNLTTYSSRLERKSGRAVESPRMYSYIMINDKARIAVPSFLNAEELLKENAEVSVVGKIQDVFCTDMSAACGPSELSPLKSVEIRF
jgi:hypothetical protein